MYNGKVVEYFKRKLETMRLDYIDSLLIHWPVIEVFEPTWEELDHAERTGIDSKDWYM